MSRLDTNAIRHTAGSADNITLDNSQNVTCEANLQVDGNVTVTGTLPAAKLTGALPAISGASLTGITTRTTPFRNLIDNGEMLVSQRGTSAISFAHDGTTSGFSLDRWKTNTFNLDEYDWTMQQVSDGPSGFPKSMKWTTGTAESAVATDEYAGVQQAFEGQDYQSLCYGTSDAKSTILSFWVKSSITGTYAVSIWRNESTQRAINGTYTISAANTWEKKTITFVGDTAGLAVTSDSIERFRIFFAVGAGATYNATATSSWANYVNGHWAGGQATNGVLTTAGATWQLTGVQFEIGSTASDYAHKSYGDELRRCLRYYWDSTTSMDVHPLAYGTGGAGMGQWTFVETMRVTPSITATNNSNSATIYARTNQFGRIYKEGTNWSNVNGLKHNAEL